MKTVTIRLPDVEAAMLVELQKSNRRIQGALIELIRKIYCDEGKARTGGRR